MKKLLLISLILLAGCTKPELPTPDVVAKDNIFSVKESTVTNNQSIFFDLPSDGVYTLTLIDKTTDQVISRERFNGQNGENVKKIYTKSVPGKYLYLLLEDINKKELGKTTIIIK
jgi:hypothetical protein